MSNYQIKKPDSIKRKKRVGCGPSSGHGKTSCRGMNGQLSRSGSKKRAWFEGGQMPLQRRVPKRGFNNFFKVEYQLVNVSRLNDISLDKIDPSAMQEAGLISCADKPVKILGNGEFSTAKTVIADAFSSTAEQKIKDAKGQVEIRK